jgi:hypothetical protein
MGGVEQVAPRPQALPMPAAALVLYMYLAWIQRELRSIRSTSHSGVLETAKYNSEVRLLGIELASKRKQRTPSSGVRLRPKIPTGAILEIEVPFNGINCP